MERCRATRRSFAGPTRCSRIPVPGKLLAIHFTAIPETATSVRILQLTIRDFLRWGVLDGIFHRINRRVLMEDRAVVESAPSEVPAAHEQRSVKTDALALAFRKRYAHELIAAASSEVSSSHTAR